MNMGPLRQRKPAKKTAGQRQAPCEKTVRRQLAGAAGADCFQNRDPVYHITEDFQKTFDWLGARRAQELGVAEEPTRMSPITPGLEERQPEEQEPPSRQGRREEAAAREKTDMDRMVQPSPCPGDRMFLGRFSQVAFNRGTMAGAVLRGSGKMMLFSCLKRSVGQSQPVNQRQQRLFEAGSQRRNVAGRSPDQVLFNRGQVDGAVGLVVDVLRDARRIVESMSELAAGENVLAAGSGAETLQKAYPFLSDRQEQALLKQYRRQLATAQTPEEEAVLQHAVVKTQALIEKKQQMKQRFITKLRAVSDAASEALAEFTQPGFSEELTQQLVQAASWEPPPEDEGREEPPEPPGSSAAARR